MYASSFSTRREKSERRGKRKPRDANTWCAASEARWKHRQPSASRGRPSPPARRFLSIPACAVAVVTTRRERRRPAPPRPLAEPRRAPAGATRRPRSRPRASAPRVQPWRHQPRTVCSLLPGRLRLQLWTYLTAGWIASRPGVSVSRRQRDGRRARPSNRTRSPPPPEPAVLCFFALARRIGLSSPAGHATCLRKRLD